MRIIETMTDNDQEAVDFVLNFGSNAKRKANIQIETKSIKRVYTTPSPSINSPLSENAYSEWNVFGSNKTKYDILENGVAHPRQCGDCSSTRTSGHWCLDPNVHEGHICQKCYRRRRRAMDAGRVYTPPPKSCQQCETSEISGKWFRHPSIVSKYICPTCYEKSKAFEIVAQARICTVCSTGSSSKWYGNAFKGYNCRKCYRKNSKFATPASNPSLRTKELQKHVCTNCKRSQSAEWYQIGGGRSLCQHCYLDCACQQCQKPFIELVNHGKLNPRICHGCSTTESKKQIQVLPNIHSVLTKHDRQLTNPYHAPHRIWSNSRLPPIHFYLDVLRRK